MGCEQYARQMLLDCWKLKEQAPANVSKVASFGKLCVRAVLHLLGREKMGREPKGFHDLKEIGRQFVDDLNSTGKKAECDDSKKDEGLTTHNLVDASASQVAMVQNDHMEVNKLSLGA